MAGPNRDGLLRAAAMISALTIVTRIAGFARVGVFSYSVGANDVGNAYNTINALPNVVFEVAVGGAMAGTIIPLLAAPLATARRAHAQPERASEVASALLTWTLSVLAPLALGLALFAGPIASAFIPEPAAAALGARLLVVFAPQVVLYGVSVVLAGALQADKRFLAPAFAPLLSSLVVMGCYAVFGVVTAGQPLDSAHVADQAVAWLGWGTTAGVAALSLPLFIPTLRSGIRLRWTYRFPPGTARRALTLASAGLGAVLAQQLSVLVVLTVANHFGGPTAQTTFGYIQACYMLAYSVLALPLITSAFPRQAELAAPGDRGAFAAMAARTTRGVLVAGLLGAAVLAGIAPAVQRVFAGIDRGDVSALGQALPFFAVGVVGLAVVTAASRGLYALEHGRAAGSVTAVGWLVMSAVIAIGTVAMLRGHSGRPATTLSLVGAAFSIGMLVAAVAGIAALRRHAGQAALAGLGRTAVVGAVGALIAAGVARLIVVAGAFTGVWGNVGLAVGGAVAALVVLGAALLVADRGLAELVRRGGGNR